MINITNPEDCTGCQSCLHSCPKHCISMYSGGAGHRYPQVEHSNCINCGLCERVCPMIARSKLKEKSSYSPRAYALISASAQQLQESTSAGAFAELARACIAEGGVVFGARWGEDWRVYHDSAETWENCEQFFKSKYLQSELADSYPRALTYLRAGRRVLFSGTGCQIAGLKSYLRHHKSEHHPLLLCVGIACYGTPSADVWCAFLKELQQVYNLGEIVEVQFRKKTNGSSLTFEVKGSKASYNDSSYGNLYGKGLANGLLNRPSCNNCAFREGLSGADLTLADFRDADKIDSKLQPQFGLSLTICHNQHGEHKLLAIAEQCALLEEKHYASAIAPNHGLRIGRYSHPKQVEFSAQFQGPDKAIIRLLNQYQIGNHWRLRLHFWRRRLLTSILCRMGLWNHCRDPRISKSSN